MLISTFETTNMQNPFSDPISHIGFPGSMDIRTFEEASVYHRKKSYCWALS
jgi:hypothetical protein